MNFLVFIRNQDYVSSVISVIKNVYNDDQKKILYISLVRPYKSLIGSFSEQGLDTNKVIVIDGITKRIMANPQEFSNCRYASSPTAHDEIISSMKDILKSFEVDNIIFDPLSQVSIYSYEADAIKFIHELLSTISVLGNCEATFLCMKSDRDSSFISNVSGYVDRIIDLA